LAELNILTSPVDAIKLGTLVKAIESGNISGKAGKEVLDYLMKNDIEVNDVIEKLGLKQLSDDSAILTIIDEILSNNQDKVDEYKAGKETIFKFFMRQTMAASKGKANPKIVNKLLKKLLN